MLLHLFKIMDFFCEGILTLLISTSQVGDGTLTMVWHSQNPFYP
ncbi:hypothetical protein CY35_06G016400 [Sphagnum magellanicum]|nr:hypothetical protein CY35_06G016400 [Sphagnum magellanicum]